MNDVYYDFLFMFAKIKSIYGKEPIKPESL